MIPPKDEGRAASDRATPESTSSKRNLNAPGARAAINFRAWLIGFALDVQRADVAMIALALAGWPR